ncbi:MAG: hypothetical protein M3512_04540 [Bacteroidota bacterium]|nr:hypothetical protein [Bacteroidota bacterium]
MTKFNVTKEEIIAEYMVGGISFRKIGKKYNIPSSTISGWVQTYQGRKVLWRDRMRRKKVKEQLQELPQLPEDVKQLQASLRKAELYMSSSSRMTFDNRGLSGLPWGAPSSRWLIAPPSIMPLLKY